VTDPIVQLIVLAFCIAPFTVEIGVPPEEILHFTEPKLVNPVPEIVIAPPDFPKSFVGFTPVTVEVTV